MALHWFEVFEGAGLDGVIAKRADGPYAPGKRTMAKIKHARTADCVVAGFRWHKNGPGTLVGSLLLGLWNDEGHLQHVGVTSSFTMAKRAELVEFLEPYRRGGMDDHPWREWAIAEAAAVEEGQRLPGATSRWNRGKDLSWEPVRPELVCEVAFDHLQGDRFRHAATFRRWRTDRSPGRLPLRPARGDAAGAAGRPLRLTRRRALRLPSDPCPASKGSALPCPSPSIRTLPSTTSPTASGTESWSGTRCGRRSSATTATTTAGRTWGRTGRAAEEAALRVRARRGARHPGRRARPGAGHHPRPAHPRRREPSRGARPEAVPAGPRPHGRPAGLASRDRAVPAGRHARAGREAAGALWAATRR